MKSQFILSGFADEISTDFTEQLSELKVLHIAHIEIRGVNGKNITAHSLKEVELLKVQLDEAGISVSAIGSPIGKIPITEAFEPHFELFKHTVEIAKILETPYIRLFSFYLEGLQAQNCREEVISRLRQMTQYVAGTGLVLLHENEKDIYGDVPERCLDLVKTLGSPNFKLIFDPANFVQCRVETYPHAYTLLKEEVIYYHIKDAILTTGQVVPSGYGDGQLPAILRSLKERGFKGFLSLEPHLGHFEGFETLESENNVPEFKERSDAAKFRLAHSCLMNLIAEVQNETS